MSKLKRKVGDKVIINEKFISAMGKEAVIDSIETDKTGREWYRLRHKGGLDPFNWTDGDFFDDIEEMNKMVDWEKVEEGVQRRMFNEWGKKNKDE